MEGLPRQLIRFFQEISLTTWTLILLPIFAFIGGLLYTSVVVLAPTPRPPRKSEKEYITILSDGSKSKPLTLPSWYDEYVGRRATERAEGGLSPGADQVEDAATRISVVIPAYNEENRLTGMLDEAIEFLQKTYPRRPDVTARTRNTPQGRSMPANAQEWEILIISDGSTDCTVDIALAAARRHKLSETVSSSKEAPKWPTSPPPSPTFCSGTLRVVQLDRNRGKGGAVTHGMRHVRGEYVMFADADGASRFADMEKLIRKCQSIQDSKGRAVAIGSRAHLVGSDSIVKRSPLRNALMHMFHLLLRFMTPPVTSRINDTQCGFKLFTRATLPDIIPYMHSEGWIFDVEMLMLAEAAKVPMAEVSIGWKEVTGSKLNVIWDSLGMAWGLAILRAAWITGVYKRDA